MLDLTWLADWGAGWAMVRDDAVAWAAGLDLFGITGWQLPASDTEVDGCDYRTGCGSALAHLFYVTLGNLGSTDADGNPRGGDAGLDWGLVNTAGFADMQADGYLALPLYPPTRAARPASPFTTAARVARMNCRCCSSWPCTPAMLRPCRNRKRYRCCWPGLPPPH